MLVFLAGGVGLAASGCGGRCGGAVGTTSCLGADVGGSCSSNDDCDEICSFDKHYPNICTSHCHQDAECPSGTACVKDEGGICAVTCSGAGDCDGFGAGWDCESRDLQGEPGKVAVCRVH